MKIVFLGTPEIARICLEKLYNSKHEILAVVTQPDRPSGRGNKLKESEVKIFAKQHNLKIFQFEKISKEGVEVLKALNPDALVLVAYGQILSEEVLGIALPLNLHGSLLPAYRGASPVQTAILMGETQTGATVMKMEKGVDDGEVLLQEKINISSTDTSADLFKKMGNVGGDLLVKALNLVESGKAVFVEQDHSKATFTAKFTKESAELDFNSSAKDIVNKIRAYNPNPVAFFMLNGEKIKVYSAEVVSFNGAYEIGEIARANAKDGLIIKAKDGFVKILTLQAPNGKVLPANAFLNGRKIDCNVVVGK